jgi:integrase
MARHLQRLSALTVKKAKKPGYLRDGGGLILQVRSATSKSWIFQYTVRGKTREMGLGSAADFTLEEARERATAQRKLLADGSDPIAERDKQRQAKQLEAAKAITFKECASAYITAHTPGWRNPKHADQWGATLETYAYPTIGAFPVQAVDIGLVLKVLQPIWTKIPETASRVRGRIEAILDYATASGFRTGDNPARWGGLLSELLPKKTKVRKVKHMAALPYADLPAFMTDLKNQDGTAARTLELVILCANRTGEAIGFRWTELDRAEKVWTIPGERMKSGREHRVPLSDRALEIIEAQRGKDAVYVFPAEKGGKPISNMAMLMLLRRMGRDDITVHGFRSSFKEWTRERPVGNLSREIAEAALAHVIGDKTEAAYARGDVLEPRRQLMAAWARYCAKAPAAAAAPGETVVPMVRQA